MADESKGGGNPWEPLIFIALLIGGLLVLWYFNGGPERDKNLRGIFLAPPPPLGSGEPYGPEIGTPTSSPETQE